VCLQQSVTPLAIHTYISLYCPWSLPPSIRPYTNWERDAQAKVNKHINLWITRSWLSLLLFHQEHPELSKLDLNKFHVDPDQCPVDLLCDVDEVVELLSSLDIAKASSGPDNTSAHMLKATACSIAPSVIKLFNICIRSWTLPSMWKCTNMVPIPKGKDMNQVSNYRPILLLSILSVGKSYGQLDQKASAHYTVWPENLAGIIFGGSAVKGCEMHLAD